MAPRTTGVTTADSATDFEPSSTKANSESSSSIIASATRASSRVGFAFNSGIGGGSNITSCVRSSYPGVERMLPSGRIVGVVITPARGFNFRVTRQDDLRDDGGRIGRRWFF